MASYTVRRQTELGSRNFGIYRDGQLIEGGFFSRAVASAARADYVRATAEADRAAQAAAERSTAQQHAGEPDVVVGGIGGTVLTFTAKTNAGRDWFAEHVDSEPWQWLGRDTLAVEHRYAGGLISEIADDGLRVRVL